MKIYAPWEKTFEKIKTPFQRFIHAQTTTGLMLMTMTIIALLLANTPLTEEYAEFFHTQINLSIGSWNLSHNIHHWINDGLMAIFFFVIGLEIKREALVGELSNIKVALLPIIAAVGGMILPAIIYTIFNYNGEGANGWGIPMATDIAFAISALVLLGKRVSSALVTFLVALAIVDDLGAVAVIAIFYTEEIHMVPLGLALGSFIVMAMFNRFGIRAVLPYFIIGLIMWFFMLESGIHATIAGVIAALTIPSKPGRVPSAFTEYTKKLLDEYDKYPIGDDYMIHDKQRSILHDIKDTIDDVSTPAAKLEHQLHLPVALIVIPLFALANAGISIDFSSVTHELMSSVSMGVIFGLIVGKVLGIAGISWIAIKLGIAQLPENTTMNQLFGVAFLGGIGFTMSIFVAELAFAGNATLIFDAKIGILCASLTSGLIGYIWLRNAAKTPKAESGSTIDKV